MSGYYSERLLDGAARKAPPPSPAPETPAPLSVVADVVEEPIDPSVLQARQELAEAQAALDQAEAQYAENQTKQAWARVQEAAVEHSRRSVLCRQAERKAEEERSARLAAERKAALERFRELCAVAGEEYWREQLRPLMIESAKIDLRQFEIAQQLQRIAQAQASAAMEALRLAKDLGPEAAHVAKEMGHDDGLPSVRTVDHARQYVGWAVFDARTAAADLVFQYDREGYMQHWSGHSTHGLRDSESMKSFLDGVLEQVRGAQP